MPRGRFNRMRPSRTTTLLKRDRLRWLRYGARGTDSHRCPRRPRGASTAIHLDRPVPPQLQSRDRRLRRFLQQRFPTGAVPLPAVPSGPELRPGAAQLPWSESYKGQVCICKHTRRAECVLAGLGGCDVPIDGPTVGNLGFGLRRSSRRVDRHWGLLLDGGTVDSWPAIQICLRTRLSSASPDGSRPRIRGFPNGNELVPDA